MYMNNPNPNNRRNMRRIAVLLAIILALLLCLRLCKRETTEEPTPPPTHQQTRSPKATTQHNNKDMCAIAQGKAGRHAKLGGRRKVGKVQHLDKPATRKPRKKNVTADEKSPRTWNQRRANKPNVLRNSKPNDWTSHNPDLHQSKKRSLRTNSKLLKTSLPRRDGKPSLNASQ